jgi:hypothetical protein
MGNVSIVPLLNGLVDWKTSNSNDTYHTIYY